MRCIEIVENEDVVIKEEEYNRYMRCIEIQPKDQLTFRGYMYNRYMRCIEIHIDLLSCCH